MIELRQGDILTADVEALVNTVNCVGVMGRGIALQFREAFPENFKIYQQACKRGEVEPGRVLVFETGRLTNPRYIINVPTKRHWRGKSRMLDIEAGLVALIAELERRNIRSVAIPPLGSGLGGLDWREVRPRIEQALAKLPGVQALVYEPLSAPQFAKAPARATKVPAMTPGRAALVGLIDRYLAGFLDPTISLLEVHKLMYFMQEAGELLSLRYTKALYGPYAENLRHVLAQIEGYLVTGFVQAGDKPDMPLVLVPGAVADAREFLTAHEATNRRFDRVVDLVNGFESPFGLELLSSVHWVASRDGAATPDEAVQKMYAWNEHKRQFSRSQIHLAWSVLEDKGWVPRPNL